ncbi:MAG: helix-turn-helix domain-containing protein [Gemmatimonadota bacterium]|jgi:putative transcriptional regulator|nr:helix-turn-helix domain-containing protein [Gemmatimonadota bacterium]
MECPVFDESDEDRPPTDDEFERGLFAMLARNARAGTGLSQVDFAKTYGIPVATIREWEQGRRRPDAASEQYLRVILRIPEEVARALGRAA